jgi:hypothetical protein
MTDTTQRPLIDVAREKAKVAKRELIAGNSEYSECYVVGYDDGRESATAEKNAGFVDTLTLASQRIAELEAQLASRPQATGVVVDDEVVDTARRTWAKHITGDRDAWERELGGTTND